jgi:hypothetical protein
MGYSSARAVWALEAAHSALCCSIDGLAGLAGRSAAQGFDPHSKTYAA